MKQIAVTDGHRGVGVAVIRPLKTDETVFLRLIGVMPVADGDFEGHFERGGACVGVKNFVKNGRGE